MDQPGRVGRRQGQVLARVVDDARFVRFALPPDAEETLTRFFRMKIQSVHFCGRAFHDAALLEGAKGSARFAVLFRARADTMLNRLLPAPPRAFRTTIITNASRFAFRSCMHGIVCGTCRCGTRRAFQAIPMAGTLMRLATVCDTIGQAQPLPLASVGEHADAQHSRLLDRVDPRAGAGGGNGNIGVGRYCKTERGKGNAGRLHHARDQRHQGFGMAALHRLRFLRDHAACAGVEHGRGAGIKRGIDGEDEHDSSVEVFEPGLNASPRYFRVYIHREAAATPLYLRSALPVEIAEKRLAPHFRCVCIIMQLYDSKLLKLREIRFLFTCW